MPTDEGSAANGLEVRPIALGYDVVDDLAHLAAGAGCVPLSAHHVSCSGPIAGVAVGAGGGDDDVALPGVAVAVLVSGGEGSDLIEGGSGDDRLTGGPGEDTILGAGSDQVFGTRSDTVSCSANDEVRTGTAPRPAGCARLPRNEPKPDICRPPPAGTVAPSPSPIQAGAAPIDAPGLSAQAAIITLPPPRGVFSGRVMHRGDARKITLRIPSRHDMPVRVRVQAATLPGVVGLLVTLVFNTLAVRQSAQQDQEARETAQIGLLTQLNTNASESERRSTGRTPPPRSASRPRRWIRPTMPRCAPRWTTTSTSRGCSTTAA